VVWSLLDTFVPFFLSYRPTRMLAFLATMAFHVTNKFMLNIGVFPYVMIGISFIYFDPDWPLEPYYGGSSVASRTGRARD
jgi:vitamin K-dependent gamma-carboxylase